MRKVEAVNIDAIKIGQRHRELREEQVSSLVQSISSIGLRTPITVRQASADDEMVLVAGAHRLEACRRLFMDEIDAFVIEDDNEDAARMWEIAENLHRAELTALERSEHVSEWVRLAEKKAAETVAVAICDDNDTRKDGRKKGHQHKERGINAAARELNIDRDDAHRAVKVASLSEEAKEVAREVGLDDNRSALLDAARRSSEDQAERLRELARERELQKRLRDTRDDFRREARQEVVAQSAVGVFLQLWSEACDEDKRAIYDIVKRWYAAQAAA